MNSNWNTRDVTRNKSSLSHPGLLAKSTTNLTTLYQFYTAPHTLVAIVSCCVVIELESRLPANLKRSETPCELNFNCGQRIHHNEQSDQLENTRNAKVCVSTTTWYRFSANCAAFWLECWCGWAFDAKFFNSNYSAVPANAFSNLSDTIFG